MANTKTPAPAAPKPFVDPLVGAPVVALRVQHGVTLMGRGTLTLFTSAATKNPGLSSDSGGFQMTVSGLGVVVVDPKNKTRLLVPYSNVLSAELGEE